jgi:hypothetical protein
VGLRRGSFARLAEALRRKADTLELALYFRDPSSHYLSAVQQGVKFGFRVEDPLIESTYRKDYQKVSGWGADVLRVRVFDRSRLTRGCVFQDFMRQVVGVDEPWLDDVPVRESNLSVSAESMLLLQGFNRVHFSLRRRPGNPLSSAFVAALLEAEGALDVTRPRLVPAMRRVIENDVHADIVWLRDEAGLVFDGFPYESPHEEDEQMRHLRDNHASLQLREVIGVDPARVELLRREVLDQLLAKASSAAAPTSRMHWLPRSLAGWRRLLRFAPRAKASGADGLRKRLFAQQRRREQRRRNQAVDSPEHLQVPFEEAVYFRVLKELLA